jgi:hypothetical protein
MSTKAHRRFFGRKIVTGSCKICGKPTRSQWKRFCDTCLSLPRCRKCKSKLRVTGSRFCIDCNKVRKEENRLKHIEYDKAFRNSPKGKAWEKDYEQSPKGKAKFAKAEQEYYATPLGHLRSNWLHVRRYRRLHNLEEITFEEYCAERDPVTNPIFIKVDHY